MFEKLNQKERAYGTLIVFGILAIIFWYLSDSFSLWTSIGNPWIVMIASIILNPAYIFLIYILWKEYDLRGLISGLLISISIDIVSLSHSVNMAGILPTSAEAIPLYSYADTTFFKIIMPFVQGRTASFILYVIIPIALVYLALRIIRKNASFNRILKEAL